MLSYTQPGENESSRAPIPCLVERRKLRQVYTAPTTATVAYFTTATATADHAGGGMPLGTYGGGGDCRPPPRLPLGGSDCGGG